MTVIDIAFWTVAFLLLLGARISGVRAGRRGRDFKLADLNASLTVEKGQRRAAVDRADRMERDLRDANRQLGLAKESAAAEKETLWANLNNARLDVEDVKGDLVEARATIADLSKALNGVEALKAAVAAEVHTDAQAFLAGARKEGV